MVLLIIMLLEALNGQLCSAQPNWSAWAKGICLVQLIRSKFRPKFYSKLCYFKGHSICSLFLNRLSDPLKWLKMCLKQRYYSSIGDGLIPTDETIPQRTDKT